MHYWLGLKVDEIAAALGTSAGTTKASLHQARRTLLCRFEESEACNER